MINFFVCLLFLSTFNVMFSGDCIDSKDQRRQRYTPGELLQIRSTMEKKKLPEQNRQNVAIMKWNIKQYRRRMIAKRRLEKAAKKNKKQD